MSHYLIGSLTAVENTAIAMTVHNVEESQRPDGVGGTEEYNLITAIYFANGVLHTVQLPEESFVGFGDYLIFEGGSFTAAGSHDEEDDSDDDEAPDAPDDEEPEA